MTIMIDPDTMPSTRAARVHMIMDLCTPGDDEDGNPIPPFITIPEALQMLNQLDEDFKVTKEDVKVTKGPVTEAQVIARIEKAISYLPSLSAKNRVLNYVQQKTWEDSQPVAGMLSGLNKLHGLKAACADVPNG